MIDTMLVKEMIRDLFEEEALVIGGLVAVHDVEDDLVWRLIRNLDVIRARVLERLESHAPAGRQADPVGDPAPKPHPAVAEFLARLQRA